MKEVFVSLLGKPFGIVIFQLLDATQFTIYLTLIAFIGGGLVGACITMVRILPQRKLNHLATAYIWLFQATPLLMMLFLLGLGIPRLFGIDVNPWIAAGIALIVYTRVTIPFLKSFIIRPHAACLSFILGVMPPRAMFGRSLLYVHSHRVA